MSLQVWLPLNGDTVNYGLDKHEFRSYSNTGVTLNDNGKIGKCYQFSIPQTAANLIYSADDGFVNKFINDKSFSLCAWFNTTTTAAGPIFYITYGVSIRGGNASGGTIFTLMNASRTVVCTTDAVANDGKWHHIVGTYNVETNQMKIYLDGVCKNTVNYTSGYTYNTTYTNGLHVGRNPNNSTLTENYYFNGKINDVRFYDHCLTPKEVKEISKGLIAHYPLKDIYNSSNLIINGFGELGTENWTKTAYISTTETPSADPSIKASIYNSNTTVAYTLINVNHSHTISGYFKSTGATSGTVYPAILPYDADKKFIYYQCCHSGFDNDAYKTTLSQPLKKGDTVIHATDLSAWTTGNNWYIHVAIFGYRDSYGTLYPDMEYTADCPAFASSTSDKSHIDKTNNTITLLAAFAGEDRPAGTTICQSREGSTNYYPFGGIALSSLSDWVFKTVTLVPFNYSRLKYARYIKWMTYSNVYNAGIKIVDNDSQTSTVYDVSGYKNNAIINGNLFSSTNTRRYNLSALFNQSGYINRSDFPLIMTAFTLNLWVNPKSVITAQHFLFGTFTTWVAHGIGIWRDASNSAKFSIMIKSDSENTYSNKSITTTTNVWNMLTFVYNGSSFTGYLNGVQEFGVTYGSSGTITNYNLMIGNSKYNSTAASENEETLMSDFRLYVTALSADDIKELYQAAAHIDKDNCYAYEFVEE